MLCVYKVIQAKSYFMNENLIRKGMVSITCLFLLTAGIWGLFSQTIFGSFTTNYLYAVVNIFSALVGMYALKKRKARLYCGILGLGLLFVGIFAFIEGFDDIEKWALNINEEMAILNIIFGVVLLFFGLPKYLMLYYNKL